MEQGTGVEPAFTAWEAVVLPIYEPCGVRVRIIADLIVKFKPFLTGGAGGKILKDRFRLCYNEPRKI